MKSNGHHKIPSSRNGSRHHDNMKQRDVQKHTHRHVVFGNDTPAEQLIKVLTVNNGAWTNHFRKALINLLLDFEGLYYKDHCCKDKVNDDLSRIK